ncbi:MAG: ABC transporter permease [Haloarculaceae archaeon]
MSERDEGGDGKRVGNTDHAAPDGGIATADRTARPMTGNEPTTTGNDTVRADGGQALALDRLRAVAGREYRLAVRSRWAAGVTLLFGLFTVGIVQFGASSVGPGQVDAIVATLAQLGVYVVPLAALAFGYDAVVGADENGSLELVLSLPIPQSRVVLGAFLGRALAFAGAILVGFLPGGVLAAVLIEPGVLGTYALVAIAAVLAGWAFLAVSVLVSTVAAEKTHALGGVLAAWLWFVLLHDLLALAGVATFDLSGSAVAAMVLLNPADCFRVLALSGVDVVAGGFGTVMQQASLSVPLVAAGLLAWIVGPVGLAMRLIYRRRL